MLSNCIPQNVNEEKRDEKKSSSREREKKVAKQDFILHGEAKKESRGTVSEQDMVKSQIERFQCNETSSSAATFKSLLEKSWKTPRQWIRRKAVHCMSHRFFFRFQHNLRLSSYSENWRTKEFYRLDCGKATIRRTMRECFRVCRVNSVREKCIQLFILSVS